MASRKSAKGLPARGVLESKPADGAQPEMRLTILSERKEVFPVYLGPSWYIEVPSQPTHPIFGDTVTVSGSRVTRSGETFLIAMTVTRGKDVLRLRDKDGIAAWVAWEHPSE